MRSSIWCVPFLFIFKLVIEVDSILLQAEHSLLGKPSMVAEHLQRMEKEDEALKPMLHTALKNTAATAIVGA
jgi:hypothetical protein